MIIGDGTHFDYIFVWRAQHPERRGHLCRIVFKQNFDNVLIEFMDGTQIVTCRAALRRADMEGRRVKPPALPICCNCGPLAQPVVHDDLYRNHWCVWCGGYLGTGVDFHGDIAAQEACNCQPCTENSCMIRGRGDNSSSFIGEYVIHRRTSAIGRLLEILAERKL